MAKELFCSDYDGETLGDLGRDILESFDPRFNENVKDIPVDEFGFAKGIFTVTVTWEE